MPPGALPEDLASDLQSLVRLAASVTDAHTTAIFLPEEEGVLRLAASVSLSDHLVADCTIGVGQGLVGWVAENDRTVRVSPFKHDARTLQFYDANEEIKTFLAVPVRLDGRVGVLAVDSKRSYEFAPRAEAILVGLAEEVAQRARHHRAVRRALRRGPPLEHVRALCEDLVACEGRAALLDRVAAIPAAIVPHSGVLVAWAEGAGDGLSVVRAAGPGAAPLEGCEVSVESSLVGWVKRRGALLYLADVEARKRRSALVAPGEPTLPVRSFLGAPLVVDGRCAGVLAFTGEHPTAYPRQTAEVLGIVASTVASCLAYADRGRLIEDRVGHGPRALVSYGRFLEQMGGWLADRRPVEVLVLDPVGLARRNAKEGYGAVDRLLDEVLAVVSRVLDPSPTIAPLGGGRWGVAWIVDEARPAGATERVLERTVGEKMFRVDRRDMSIRVRVAGARSERDGRDPEALVSRALAALASASPG